MIIEELTGEEADAVEHSLVFFRQAAASGEARHDLRNFETALLGYKDFSEKLVGDALRKIDYVLFPKLSLLEEGDVLALGDVTFGSIERDNGLSTTVVVGGVERFRLQWSPAHKARLVGGGFADDCEISNIVIRSLSPEDVIDRKDPRIAQGWVKRNLTCPVESTGRGQVDVYSVYGFIDATTILQSAIGADIAMMPRQRPASDHLGLSWEEFDKLMVSEVVRLDGGLPGKLAAQAVSTMIELRGGTILTRVAERAAAIAVWLEEQGCVWGGAALTMNGRDDVMYAVRSEATGNVAFLANARNSFGPFTTFLAWVDAASGTASIVAAKGGNHLSEVIRCFLRGEAPDAPTATVEMATGRHNLGSEMIDTDIMDVALHFIDSVEEERAEIADGAAAFDERFERVDDFDFFVQANAAFHFDEVQNCEIAVATP